MAIKTFTTGEVLTAADTNTYLANSGLVYVGQVSLSGTSTNVPLVFSSTYATYRMVVTGLQVNGSGEVTVQMLSGTTPATTNYARQRLYAQSGTVGGASNVSQSSLVIGYSGVNQLEYFAYDIFNPFQSSYTKFIGSENYEDGSGIPFIDITHGAHMTIASYDGIRFLCGSNSFTAGTVRIYGYRQS